MNPLFPPDVPQVAQGTGAILLGLHVAAGGIGLLSGATAMAVRKGSRLHRRAGNLFFLAMMAAGCVGAVMVPFLPKWSSVVPGLFATYLIATGWKTMRRPPAQSGGFEFTAFLAALGIAFLGCLLGLYALTSPAGRLSGAGPAYFFLVALLPCYAASLDLKGMRIGGFRGQQRLSRHIWRMSAGMFVVSVSFFPARPQMYPALLRGTPILWVPPILVVAAMIFWLFKVRGRKWFAATRERLKWA